MPASREQGWRRRSAVAPLPRARDAGQVRAWTYAGDGCRRGPIDGLLGEHREEFAADPAEISRARRLLRACLRSWGLAGLGPSLELAVGEVFTNAVRYGKGPITLVIAVLADRLRVEVHDRGGGRPAIRPVHESGPDIGGWGLRMVERLVDEWDTTVTDGHTVVRLEHALTSASANPTATPGRPSS